MTRLFIVRHGNTFETGKPARRIGARSDVPLTASGRRQAEALGDHFEKGAVSFSHAYTGSLWRTRETTEAILGSGSRLLLESAEWLTEIDHGPDENCIESDVVSRVGRAALALWDRDVIAPEGWRVDAERRIAGWQSLLNSPPEGDTLLVTSNGAARFLFLAVPIRRPSAGLKLRTCAYAVIERIGEEWSLVEWDVRP